jgi:flavodoxin
MTLVVFDSTFGNTEMVARAVAEVLSLAGPVRTLRVSEVEQGHLEGVTLLVVGSPSHASRMSPGLQAWLARFPPGGLEGVRVAAFDTRLARTRGRNPITRLLARWSRDVAAGVEKRLLVAGGSLAAPAQGFVVRSRTGPLCEGETDRARRWARTLGEIPQPS